MFERTVARNGEVVVETVERLPDRDAAVATRSYRDGRRVCVELAEPKPRGLVEIWRWAAEALDRVEAASGWASAGATTHDR